MLTWLAAVTVLALTGHAQEQCRACHPREVAAYESSAMGDRLQSPRCNAREFFISYSVHVRPLPRHDREGVWNRRRFLTGESVASIVAVEKGIAAADRGEFIEEREMDDRCERMFKP